MNPLKQDDFEDSPLEHAHIHGGDRSVAEEEPPAVDLQFDREEHNGFLTSLVAPRGAARRGYQACDQAGWRIELGDDKRDSNPEALAGDWGYNWEEHGDVASSFVAPGGAYAAGSCVSDPAGWKVGVEYEMRDPDQGAFGTEEGSEDCQGEWGREEGGGSEGDCEGRGGVTARTQ